METALKNQEMELSRNKERLQFFKVQDKSKIVFISFKRCLLKKKYDFDFVISSIV